MNSWSMIMCGMVMLLLSFYHSLTLACAVLPLCYYYIRVKDQEIERLRIVNKAKDRNFKVVVIGSGIAGLGMGGKLSKMGIDYTIIEKGYEVGGTWSSNIYPGVGCDIASHLYSFSDYINPDWSEAFSGGAEILAYLKDYAAKFDVMRHIVFDTKVTKMTWSNADNNWTLKIDGKEAMVADVVISCTGLLRVPKTPTLMGAESFTGIKIHTAKWDPNFDPKDKNVAVIGTGASGVQIVPCLVKAGVKSLTVFQRSPTWALPKNSFTWSKTYKMIFRYVPGAARLYRWYMFWNYESRFYLIFLDATAMPVIGWILARIQHLIHVYIKQHIQNIVKDPDIAKKVTPDYRMGCKRLTPTNCYLQVFNRDNVELVTEPIDYFTETGIMVKEASATQTVRCNDNGVGLVDKMTQTRLTPRVCRTSGVVAGNGMKLSDGFMSYKNNLIYNGLNRHNETFEIVKELGIYKNNMKLRRSKSEPKVKLYNFDTKEIEYEPEDDLEEEEEGHHKLDAVIYATGFDLFATLNGIDVINMDGERMEDIWSDEPRLYCGMTHETCPNFFMIGGPGIALGHNSAFFIGETQVNYIKDAIDIMITEELKYVCVKEHIHKKFQSWVKKTIKDKIYFSDSCMSWYKNSRGINWTFWPTNVVSYWWRTRRFDIENYHSK